MKRNLFSRFVILTLVFICFSLSVLFVTSQGWYKEFHLFSPFNTVFALVEDVFSKPRQFVTLLVEDSQTLLSTHDENSVLKEKLVALEEKVIRGKSIEEENESLRSSLALLQNYPDFHPITAEVIHRSPASWDQTLLISKGENDGISQNFLVMANGGVIGHVVDVSESTSTVHLLMDDLSSVNLAVKIGEKSPVYGILKYYDRDTNTFLVSQLNDKTSVKVNDTVVSSDLSDQYTPNLLVGTVTEVKENIDSLETEVYVRPAADFSHIYSAVLFGD